MSFISNKIAIKPNDFVWFEFLYNQIKWPFIIEMNKKWKKKWNEKICNRIGPNRLQNLAVFFIHFNNKRSLNLYTKKISKNHFSFFFRSLKCKFKLATLLSNIFLFPKDRISAMSSPLFSALNSSYFCSYSLQVPYLVLGWNRQLGLLYVYLGNF